MAEVRKVLRGDVHVEWLAQLPAAELRDWITDLLHGREVDIPAALSDTPHYFLLDTYEAAPAHVRQALADAVLALVQDMAWHADSPWRVNTLALAPGDRLLWVALGMEDRRCVGPVTHMVESKEFIGQPGQMPGGIHARLLQGLIALGVQETEEFWRQQVRIEPRDFLILAMRGLAEHPAANPFRLLSEFHGPWTEDMSADLVRLLDVLRMTKGAETLRSWVWAYRKAIPVAVASELADLLPQPPKRTWGAGLSPQYLEAARGEQKEAA